VILTRAIRPDSNDTAVQYYGYISTSATFVQNKLVHRRKRYPRDYWAAARFSATSRATSSRIRT